MNATSALDARNGSRFRRLRSEFGWTVVGVVIPAIAGLGVFYAGQSAMFTFIVSISVLVISTVGVLILNARKFRDSFSLLSVAAVYYFLAFGVGAIYLWTAHSRSPNSTSNILYLHPRFGHADLTRAVTLATVGWLLLVCGYLANPLARVRVKFRLHQPRASLRIAWVMVPLWIAGWAARAELIASGRYFHTLASGAVSSTSSSWVVSAASTLPTLAAAVIGSTAIRGHAVTSSNRRRKIFWLLLIVEFAWYFPSGERGSIVGLALMIAALYYYAGGRHLPLRLVLPSIALLVFVVFPLGLFYRGDNTHYQEQPKTSLYVAFNHLTSQSPRRAILAGTDATFSRFSDVASLATVVYEGRARMGLPEGRTFTWIPASVIPRAIVRNKADPGLFGNEFGRAYGILDPRDRITSVAIGQVTDFYLNFGVIGIIVGMPILGGLYRLINDIFSARRVDPLIAAIYAVCLWPFISGMEVIVALGVFGVLKTAAFFLMFLGFLSWLGTWR